MPQYYARGIGIYLKRYDALTPKPERSEIPENPIEHDGYRTRFIGPLDDMPLFLATVERDRMDASTVVQGLELMVDFTKAAKTCSIFDGSRDLKIEVLLNGDLIACRFRAAVTPPSTIEVFSGRRVGKKMERPWVLNMKPKDTSDVLTAQVLRQRWADIGRELRTQALERGTDDNGRIPYSAEYLLSLSNLSYEDVFDASVFKKRAHTNVVPSVIDVIISYGEGHKPEQTYVSKPETMKDAAYKPDNNGLSEDRYLSKARPALLSSSSRPQEGRSPPPKPADTLPSPLKPAVVGRATTPPNKLINQLSLDRSPFKSTFHVVGNVNEGTAMVSPERRRHLERASLKHSPEKQDKLITAAKAFKPTRQAIEDATRSLNDLCAGQHIEKMQKAPATAALPITPHKRRQSAAEFEEETSRLKKARFDETEILTSPSAVSKARRMDKAQKLQQPTQPANETEVRRADPPAPRFSTPASALVRFGFSSKPKSNSTPARSINTRSSASFQTPQPSVVKVDENPVWPPQSTRGCAVTYMDAKLCGVSEREYQEALTGKGTSLPYLSNEVKKEGKGDFKEKGVVCGVRYVVF